MNYFILDGLNIVHCSSAFKTFLPHNIFGALAELERLASVLFMSNVDGVLLICDGGALGHVYETTLRNPRFSLILTPNGKAADSVIVERCRRICGGSRSRSAPSVTVVSDDGGLRVAAQSLGAEVLSCETFIRQLLDRAMRTEQLLRENSNHGKKIWPKLLGDRTKLPDGI